MIPGVTAAGLSSVSPLVSEPDAPGLRATIGILFVVFSIGAGLQAR
jgi:hypothetical protein